MEKGTEITDHSNTTPQLGKLIEKMATIKKLAYEHPDNKEFGALVRELIEKKII